MARALLSAYIVGAVLLACAEGGHTTIKTPAAEKTALTPKLQRRLREHEAEVVRLRKQFGDVPESLSSLIRDSFDADTFAPRLTADIVTLDADLLRA